MVMMLTTMRMKTIGDEDDRIKDGRSCEYVKGYSPGRGQEALEKVPKLLHQALHGFCDKIVLLVIDEILVRTMAVLPT